MLHNFKKLAVVVAVGTAMALPGAAMATNGYFAHGYGTKNKGVAGAGAAAGLDAMAAATNPAAMVHAGERFDIGAAIFNPNREFTDCPVGPGGCGVASADSESNYFLVPHLAYNMPLAGDQSFGVTVYGNGGMNTDYEAPVFGFVSTGINLSQLFVNASYAKKLGNVSLGAGLILAYQQFEAKGLTGFTPASEDGANMTDNGVDSSTGAGIKVGAMVDVAPGVTLGASYQSKMDMSEFDKYAGLFADQGDFDIPSTYVLGVSWQASPKIRLAADYQRINYTDVPSVSNSQYLAAALGGTQLFGSDDGPGFGWEDIDVIKIGVEYKHSEDWTLRAGWNHGDNPISEEEAFLNILAPGVVKDHLTLGFTKAMGKDAELSFAFMHAFEEEVTANMAGAPVTIKMDQNEVELSYGMRF